MVKARVLIDFFLLLVIRYFILISYSNELDEGIFMTKCVCNLDSLREKYEYTFSKARKYNVLEEWKINRIDFLKF